MSLSSEQFFYSFGNYTRTFARTNAAANVNTLGRQRVPVAGEHIID